MLRTPYYLIDSCKLLKNMETISKLRKKSGVKVLLALKCFSTWSVFDIMRDYMDGTTSSSLFELRLGYEKFGKESHAYSVAWSKNEIEQVNYFADKIIFNSISQLKNFRDKTSSIDRGLRINPKISSSSFDLSDPTRRFSRLGEIKEKNIESIQKDINGFLIHNNCENKSFYIFNNMLNDLERRFSFLFSKVNWISLGGGIHFTDKNYPINQFANRLKKFSKDYNLVVYLEPGEAAVTNSTTLEVTVLDVLNNEKNIAIIDSSIESHVPDLLIYRENAKIYPNQGPYETMVCGKSCLAGDVFGTFRFPYQLKIGDRISIEDVGGYTMVKKNWFNGINMPSIAIKDINGKIRSIREFHYIDYIKNLS